MIQQMDVLPIQQKNQNFVLEKKELPSAKQGFKSIMQTLAQNLKNKSFKTNTAISVKLQDNICDAEIGVYIPEMLLENRNDVIGFFEQVPDFCDTTVDSMEPLSQQECMLLQNQFLGCMDPAENGFGNMFIEEAVAMAVNPSGLAEIKILQNAKILYDQAVSNILVKTGLAENNTNINLAFAKTVIAETLSNEGVPLNAVAANASTTVLTKENMTQAFGEMNLINSLEMPIKQLKAEVGPFAETLVKTGSQNLVSNLEKGVQPFLFSQNANAQSSEGFSYTEPQNPFLTDTDTDKDSLVNNLHTVSFRDLAVTMMETNQAAEKVSATEKPVVNQLVDQLEKGLANGKKEFQIELYPVNLGKVSVKMVSESGMLTLDIKALNPDTQTMLLANAGEIKAILQAAVNHNVRFAEAGAEQYTEQQYEGSGTDHKKEEQEQKEAKHPVNWVEDNDAEMTADDFLTLMQQIEAVDVAYSYVQ